MYFVFSVCPIRFILHLSLYISLPQEADIYRLYLQTASSSGLACNGPAIGKHSRGLESGKRMRSEYLFLWAPPARLWLENGCIPVGQLFPIATSPQVPKTALLFSFSRPKNDKHRSWVLYHWLLTILSFPHVCKCFHSSSSIMPLEDLISFLPGSWYIQSIKNRMFPSVRYRRILVRKRKKITKKR